MKKSFAPKSVSDSGKADDDDDDGLVSAFNLTLTGDFSSQDRRKCKSVTFLSLGSLTLTQLLLLKLNQKFLLAKNMRWKIFGGKGI